MGVQRKITMTPQERLQIMIDFYNRERRYPTFLEMVKLFGVSSKSQIFHYMKELIDAGHVLQKKYMGPIELARKYLRINTLGTIGGFSEKEGEISDIISLDEWLIADKRNTFLLAVNDDSMKEAGIQSGDVVMVRRVSEIKDGDLVVASVNGQWLLRFACKKGDAWCLTTKNKENSVIPLPSDTSLDFVVKSVIRTY